MNNRYIDGLTFKHMILSGAQRVILAQEELNQINVFPVPDGDTGSNMAALFNSIVRDLSASQKTALNQIALEVADAALNGSRGNSGAILAQFFQGMQKSIGDLDRVGLEKFAEACKTAATSAHDAIVNPVEGTIITVMRDWAASIQTHWDKSDDFVVLMNHSLESARQALIDTPKQLEILSKNQVVDAGAQGFVHFIEGATHFLQTGETPTMTSDRTQGDLKDSDSFSAHAHIDASLSLDPHAIHTDDLNHQYCTECIIHGHQLDVAKIKSALSEWGDSFVIVGGTNKVKVHIHTNSPSRVFREANLFGELLETKADDMWAQYRARINSQLQKHIALVTDSTCNLPQELFVKYNIIVLPLQIIINDKSYLDRVNLSISHFLEKMQDPSARISTSQPAPADIKTAFNKALSQSPSVVGIFLSEKLSGTYQSVRQLTQRLYEEDDIHLFDSRNLTGGLGLIVAETAKAIQSGAALPVVQKTIRDNIKNTATFVSFTTLKFAIQGGRVSKSSGWIANLLRLLPVLRVNHHGTAQKIGFAFGRAANRQKALKLACQYAKKYRDAEFIVAHAEALDEANHIAEVLRKKYPKKEIHVVETTPLLTTHVGPGTIAISILGKK